MKKIIEIVPELIKATQSGVLHWEYMEDAPCFSASYNNDNFMICRSKNDDNAQIISLNYVDKNEYIIGDFMKWSEEDSEFHVLNELYNIAEKSKKLLTTC